MVPLLESKQIVVKMTRGSERASAGVGGIVSCPMKDRYTTISVPKKATSDSRKLAIPHCAGLRYCSGSTDGGTGRDRGPPAQAALVCGEGASLTSWVLG